VHSFCPPFIEVGPYFCDIRKVSDFSASENLFTKPYYEFELLDGGALLLFNQGPFFKKHNLFYSKSIRLYLFYSLGLWSNQPLSQLET
jgi:hypothetical protein